MRFFQDERREMRESQEVLRLHRKSAREVAKALRRTKPRMHGLTTIEGY